mgnify:FL=1
MPNPFFRPPPPDMMDDGGVIDPFEQQPRRSGIEEEILQLLSQRQPVQAQRPRETLIDGNEYEAGGLPNGMGYDAIKQAQVALARRQAQQELARLMQSRQELAQEQSSGPWRYGADVRDNAGTMAPDRGLARESLLNQRASDNQFLYGRKTATGAQYPTAVPAQAPPVSLDDKLAALTARFGPGIGNDIGMSKQYGTYRHGQLTPGGKARVEVMPDGSVKLTGVPYEDGKAPNSNAAIKAYRDKMAKGKKSRAASRQAARDTEQRTWLGSPEGKAAEAATRAGEAGATLEQQEKIYTSVHAMATQKAMADAEWADKNKPPSRQDLVIMAYGLAKNMVPEGSPPGAMDAAVDIILERLGSGGGQAPRTYELPVHDPSYEGRLRDEMRTKTLERKKKEEAEKNMAGRAAGATINPFRALAKNLSWMFE